jgi:hypothetical protein
LSLCLSLFEPDGQFTQPPPQQLESDHCPDLATSAHIFQQSAPNDNLSICGLHIPDTIAALKRECNVIDVSEENIASVFRAKE